MNQYDTLKQIGEFNAIAATLIKSYSAAIAGSLYSGALSYAVPDPPTLAPGRVYPTTVRSAGGGWRYEPLAGTQTTYVSDETFTGWVDGVYGTYHYQITFDFRA